MLKWSPPLTSTTPGCTRDAPTGPTPSPMTELVKIREKNTPEVKGLWSEVQYNTKAVIKALSPKLTKL